MSEEMGIELIEGTDSLPLHWVGDRYLIELFHLYGFKGKELVCLNCCRIYLQVITLSDISMANGKHITYEAWNGYSH